MHMLLDKLLCMQMHCFLSFLSSLLFQKSLQTYPVSRVFPKYVGGPQDFDASVQFVAAKFREVSNKPPRLLVTHTTNATDDPKNVQQTLESLTTVLIKNYLKDFGMY